MSPENHVENPFEYVLERISWIAADARRTLWAKPRPRFEAPPRVRQIGLADLREALRAGVRDLGASRADVLFLGLIYPTAGLVLATFAFNYALLPLVFPLVSGFALIGPLAAIGLYEISRRREKGEPVTWTAAADVLRSPNLGSVLGLGSILLILFFLWLAVAYGIYVATLGSTPPASIGGFVRDVFQTGAGWAMIVAGVGVGFLFAALAFAISVVSFPLLLDRNVGMATAVATSLRAVVENPGPMAAWGAIVAALLVVGSAPALVGLIVVMPVLGHATWHLYRRVVA